MRSRLSSPGTSPSEKAVQVGWIPDEPATRTDRVCQHRATRCRVQSTTSELVVAGCVRLPFMARRIRWCAGAICPDLDESGTGDGLNW
jgi:hypothetical protein